LGWYYFPATTLASE